MGLYEPTQKTVYKYEFDVTNGEGETAWGKASVTFDSPNPAQVHLVGGGIDMAYLRASNTEDIRNIMDCVDELMGWNSFASAEEN